MNAKISAFCLSMAVLLTLPTISRAALSENEPVLKPRPLDVVQEEIVKKHKSKHARALKKAWDALKAKKFAGAIHLSAGPAKNPLFYDYGNWINAAANYGAALKALEGGRFSGAVKAAEKSVAASLRIAERAPASPMMKNLPRDMGLAEVLQGDAYVGIKKWSLAQTVFERGFQRLSMNGSLGLVRPDSLLHYATACSEDEGDLCEAWILRFGAYYPKNSEEMRAVIKVFPNAGDRPRSAFPGRGTQAYKSPDLDQTAFEANLGYYLDGKFGAAIRGFQQFADEFPKSAYRFRARYWYSQALTHEQEHEKAQKAYESLQRDSPLTYYGLLASISSGKSMDATIDAGIPKAIERDPLLQPQEVIRITRAEQFIAEGAYELAAQELKDFRSRDPLSNPFLMYLATLNCEAHTYSTAFSIMSDLIARGYEGAASSSFLRLVFPIANFDTIKKYATQYEMDPILLLSLIKQESAFDIGAISSSGALGLMQLMPATAADTDREVPRADLVLADPNIRVGAKYLKYLLTRFNGNIVYSLAGYNAGPNAVDRWIRASGGKRPMLEFIETIPYKETREYVGAIIRNYYWYAKNINPLEHPKPLAFFWGLGGGVLPAPHPSAQISPEPLLPLENVAPVPVPLPEE